MKRVTTRLIRYRLESARETLAEAESLLRDDHRRGAMNRIYYAMFYATLAMLALRNLSSSKHSGAISLFHREFVKSGEFPPALAKRLDVAFDWRLAGDYKEFVSLKREDLIAFYDDAKSFLNQAEDVVSRALPSHISLHRGLNS